MLNENDEYSAENIRRQNEERERVEREKQEKEMKELDDLLADDLQFRMLIPALDRFFMELLEEPDVSISEFIREPTLKMAPETRAAMRSWLVKVFAEIYRVVGAIEHRYPLPPERR